MHQFSLDAELEVEVIAGRVLVSFPLAVLDELSEKLRRPADGHILIWEEEDGVERRAIWLGERAYADDQRDDVPEAYRETFDKALGVG